MVTYGQFFCDVQVQVGSFSACYTYAQAIEMLAAMLMGMIAVVVIVVILWTLQAAWLRYQVRKQGRVIAAMAMAK